MDNVENYGSLLFEQDEFEGYYGFIMSITPKSSESLGLLSKFNISRVGISCDVDAGLNELEALSQAKSLLEKTLSFRGVTPELTIRKNPEFFPDGKLPEDKEEGPLKDTLADVGVSSDFCESGDNVVCIMEGETDYVKADVKVFVSLPEYVQLKMEILTDQANMKVDDLPVYEVNGLIQ